MSNPGSRLVGAIKAVLWLLFRLLVLALTGNWIGGRDAEQATDPAFTDDDELPGATGQPWASPHGQADVDGWLQSLESRTAQVRDEASALHRPGNVPRACDALRSELEECRVEAIAAGPAALARGHAAQLALGFLERSLGQRNQSPAAQAWLAALDRLADDLGAPVYELLDSHDGLRHPRVWVAAWGRLGESQQRELLQSPVGALGVERGLAERPETWPALAPRVARSLLFDVPGLVDELMHRHQLPAAVPLPHSHVGIGPDEVHGALGVWLEPLFADVFATLRLGPAYPRFLLRTLSDGGPAQRAHAATAAGSWLSPVPPRSVRIHAVVRVLELLGQHQEEDAVWQAWTERHGDVDSLFFPTADGTWNAIPASYFFALLEPLLESLTTERLQSLDQSALADVPDMEFGHADDAHHRRLRKLFATGREERHAPYITLAAASRAVAEDGADPALVAQAAQRALGVPAPLVAGAGREAHAKGGASGPAARATRGTEPPTLAAAVRSRRIQREAIVLAAALGTRRPVSPTWRARRPPARARS